VGKTKLSGDIGEHIAEEILVVRGYTIVSKNFRSKFGEIDIIAKEGGELVFVEVKTRWSKKFGKPEEAVTKRKLDRIKRTIDYYFLLNTPEKHRIEVVAIQFNTDGSHTAKLISVTS